LAVNTTTHKEREREREREEDHPSLFVLSQTLSVCVLCGAAAAVSHQQSLEAGSILIEEEEHMSPGRNSRGFALSRN
jgi:hypothetical protein